MSRVWWTISVQQVLEVLRPPFELPIFSHDGPPIFVFNWSFRSSIFTAQFPGGVIQLLHASTVSGFLCLLCQAIDVVLLVCLDVSLDLIVGFCILFVPLPFPLSCVLCSLWLSSSFLTQSSLMSRLISTPCADVSLSRLPGSSRGV